MKRSPRASPYKKDGGLCTGTTPNRYGEKIVDLKISQIDDKSSFFKVKCRILSLGHPNLNAKGDKNVLHVLLGDETGKIKGIAFNNLAVQFCHKLWLNAVFNITFQKLIDEEPHYPLNNYFNGELYLNSRTRFEENPGDHPEIPKVQYRPFKEVLQMEFLPVQMINIIGIISNLWDEKVPKGQSTADKLGIKKIRYLTISDGCTNNGIYNKIKVAVAGAALRHITQAKLGEIVTIDGAERMLLDGYIVLLISATGSISTYWRSWLHGPSWTDEHYSGIPDELSEWYRFLDDNEKKQFHELSKEDAEAEEEDAKAEEEDAEAEEEDAKAEEEDAEAKAADAEAESADSEALENAAAESTEKADTKANAEAPSFPVEKST